MEVQASPVRKSFERRSDQVIEALYEFPAPQVTSASDEGPGRVQFSKSYHIAAPSKPDLAMYEARVLLPAGMDIARLETIVLEEEQLPSRWVAKRTADVAEYVLTRREQSTTCPPAEITPVDLKSGSAHLVGVYSRRGATIAIINIFPVHFDEDAGALSYVKSLRLRLHLSQADRDGQLPYRADRYRPIAEEVDNPQELASYRGGASTRETFSLCEPDGSADYVIITSEELAGYEGANGVADVVSLKQSQGLSVKVVTVREIIRSYDGDVPAVKIRQFIREAYAQWGTDFVLLLGDADVVPSWGVNWGGDEAYIVPSDIYYRCLDGESGSAVGQGLRVGMDWLADVYVGRAAVSTTADLSNWVAKLQAYHKALAGGRRDRKVLMVGSYMGLGGETEWAKPQLEQVRQGGRWDGIDAAGIDSRGNGSVVTFYDYDRPIPKYMGYEVRDELNTDQYGVMIYLGHDSPGVTSKMERQHVEGLTNATPFVAYISSCRSGDYSRNGAASSLLAAKAGAVCVVAYSGQTVNGPRRGHTQVTSRYFWDTAVTHPDWPVGVVVAASHDRSAWLIWHMAQQMDVFSSNLLGDPAMPMALPAQ